jgi:hypothetical protein
LIVKKEGVENRRDVLWVFMIYLAGMLALSLPFVLLDWPHLGWMKWPF